MIYAGPGIAEGFPMRLACRQIVMRRDAAADSADLGFSR